MLLMNLRLSAFLKYCQLKKILGYSYYINKIIEWLLSYKMFDHKGGGKCINR